MIAHDRGSLGTVDSRVKIIWLLATLVAGLVFAQPLSLGIILGSIVAVAVLGGVLAETIRRMRGRNDRRLRVARGRFRSLARCTGKPNHNQNQELKLHAGGGWRNHFCTIMFTMT